MKNRVCERRGASGWMVTIAMLAMMSLFGGGFAIAADGDSATWEIEGDLGGQFVEVSKSQSSFRQDHKLRTGGEVSLNGVLEWKDHRTLEIRGFGQSGEPQGYFVSDYRKLGHYGLVVDFSSWEESYNARSGRLDETIDGSPLAGNTFPGTNDGRFFFSGGSPSTNWMNGGLVFDYQAERFFSDVYLDLHVRRVDGEQTLAKTGAILSDVALITGPYDLSGLVEFGFPSQKKVDYLSYLASVGTETAAGNANWQFALSYANHKLESETTEVNYFANPDGTIPVEFSPDTTTYEAEIYKEDTDLHIGKIDMAVARHIRPNLYVYGSGSFMYERSSPEPEQAVARPNQATRTTRTTDGGKVTRLSPVVSMGSVFQPNSATVVRLDSSFRYSMQEGRINEDRDESTVQPGDVGVGTRNRVDRDGYVGRINLSIDNKLAPRTRLTFDARYRYRSEIVDSRRTVNFIGRPDEREQFASKRQRIELGPTLKYRLRRGRSFEVGYRYLYEVFSVDINEFDTNELEFQFVLNNFNVNRHKAFAKLRGRIAKNLRGEMRVEYVNELRDMESPLIEPAATSAGGKFERESVSFFSSVYYQLHKDWNLNASLSVRQLKMELVDEGPQPGGLGLVDFEYNTVTETLTAGASYRPSDKWSGSFSYSLFNSNKSVDNMGHTARLSGDYRLDDTWRFYGSYGFYLYRRDGTAVDDYDAHVVSLGVNARF